MPGKENATTRRGIAMMMVLVSLALATILAHIATGNPTPVKKSREFAREIRRRNSVAAEHRNEQNWGERHDGLRRIIDALPDIDTQPLILLIDQFEEVYTQCQDTEERRQFLDNLLCAAADPSSHVSVILTLRSDFLSQTQSHPEFSSALAANEAMIPFLNEAELRQAIASPAENAGHALDAACVNFLVDQTLGCEGALPLLQFALMKIWDGLAENMSPAATLKQIGGVEHGLAGEAQRLFDHLSQTDKAIARRAFLALVQLGEGARDTCRRISLTETVAHNEEPTHVEAVLRYFANPRTRLVTFSTNADGTQTVEMTHEALLEYWPTLTEWVDANREESRFHRRLARDAARWEAQERVDSLLWRSPDLDLLRQYRQHTGQNMTSLQLQFFQASERKERHWKRGKRLTFIMAVIILAVISICAAGVAFWTYREANTQKIEAERQKMEAERQRIEAERLKALAERQPYVPSIRSVVAYAYKDDAQGERERAALLARQAHILNQRYQGDENDRIEDALRTIFRIAAIEEGPGRDAAGTALIDMVCQMVKFKTALTPDEWENVVGHDIAYEPACPELRERTHIQLRSDTMTTTDLRALSLNLRDDGDYGYPIRYVENQFEDKGDVIVDRATGLMWQKSGSREPLTYEEARKYIDQLNRKRFGGYDDWRLPTIEELLSLVEPELSSEYLYLDPVFDSRQKWVWSADLWHIQDEEASGSAWNVYFSSGNVHWLFLNSLSYVRAVRAV